MAIDDTTLSASEKRELIRRAAGTDGAAFLDVAGDSMEPLLRVGDRVGLVPCDPDDLRVGDLLAYDDNGATVCHRFLGWESEGGRRRARQKGDNLSAGSLVEPGSILGRAAMIECAGRRVDLRGAIARRAQRAIGRYRALFPLDATGTPIGRRIQWLVVRPLACLTRRC